jgi:hypothetical protein
MGDWWCGVRAPPQAHEWWRGARLPACEAEMIFCDLFSVLLFCFLGPAQGMGAARREGRSVESRRIASAIWDQNPGLSHPFTTAACPPAIAYSRVDTGRTPSAAPSSSKFPASHSGLALGLIARFYRAFFDLRYWATSTTLGTDVVAKQLVYFPNPGLLRHSWRLRKSSLPSFCAVPSNKCRRQLEALGGPHPQ